VDVERRTEGLSRGVLALLRRIFRRCQGKPVNRLSRQMTPEEAVEMHACLEAHGIQGRKGSSVNEVPSHSGEN
jgi:hypothetical protein